MASPITQFKDQFPHLAGKLTTAADLPRTEHGITARLIRKFGLGQNPTSRRSLYKWLEDQAKEHEETVLEAISIACAQAVSARHPDRYFCTVVLKILRQKGIAKQINTEAASW